MIKERMIELLILLKVIQEISGGAELVRHGKKYDKEKVYKRFDELIEEFLEPYVIESGSKE